MTRLQARFFNCCVPLIIFLIASSKVGAQMIVNNTVNAADGVQNVLLGPGVSASNITFQGTPEQIGQFTCNGCNLGLETGLVMASGNVDGASGPNTSGSFSLAPASGFGASDPDLFELSGNSLNDAAVLEFDFIPTGDSVAFNFVFGSDEYPEFANSSFNDAFGFFLSGPGITGPYLNNAINIAEIPGTTLPLTINNLNNGTAAAGPCEFCQFYVNNNSSFGAPTTAIQPDGFTLKITASAQVQCGETYHIKLAIADALDTSYDSYVFLQAGSFQSNQLNLSYSAPPNLSPAQDGIYEGCQSGVIAFERPPGITSTNVFDLIIGGSAQPGVDYLNIPNQIVFLPNQTQVLLDFTAIADGVFEGQETITIGVEQGICNSSDVSEISITISDLPSLNVVLDDVSVNCGEQAVLTPQISGGIGFYHVNWVGFGEQPTLTLEPSSSASIAFTVTDTCGVTPYAGNVSVSLNPIDPIVIDLGNDLSISCLDPVTINSSVSGGFGALTYDWNFNGTPMGNDTGVTFDPDEPGELELTITDECDGIEQESIDISFLQLAIGVNLGPDLNVTCLDNTTLSAAITGALGNVVYEWSDQSGVLGSDPTITYQTSDQAAISLDVSDECGNTGSDIIVLAVPQVNVSIDVPNSVIANCNEPTVVSAEGAGGVGSLSYEWRQGSTVLSTTEEVTVQSFTPLTLVLEITDQCENNQVISIPVIIDTDPIALSIGNDQSGNCNDVFSFEASISGNIGTTQYSWAVNGIPAGSSTSITTDINTSSLVTLSVIDQCGTTATDNAQINMEAIPLFVTLNPDTAICMGETILLKAETEGGAGTITYTWSEPGAFGSQVNVAPSSSTLYTVNVADNCGNSDEASVLVSVDDVEPAFTARYEGEFGITVENLSEGEESILWAFSDGTTSLEPSYYHEFADYNQWEVTLLAYSPLGCVRRISQTFEPPSNIFVPNSFSPNFDGFNDVWKIEAFDLRWFEVVVFNRWGETVYESKDFTQVWDGSFKGTSDHALPDGVYPYVLKAENNRGRIFEYSGYLHILR